MATRISYASKIHDIQKDFGFTNSELKQAVKEATRPRVTKLPEFRLKLTKEEKRIRKRQRQVMKVRKYDLAHWLLNDFLDPDLAEEIYETHLKFKDLVDYASGVAIEYIRFMTTPRKPTDLNELYPPPPDDEYDIPSIFEKEFEEFEDKHPPRKDEGIIEYRRRFKRHQRKRRRRLYSKKRMRIYDPLYQMDSIDEKKMLDNIKRISRENAEQTREFHRMLDKLYGDRALSADKLAQFKEHTEAMQRASRRRLKEVLRNSIRPPTKITFEFPDGTTMVSSGY